MHASRALLVCGLLMLPVALPGCLIKEDVRLYLRNFSPDEVTLTVRVGSQVFERTLPGGGSGGTEDAPPTSWESEPFSVSGRRMEIQAARLETNETSKPTLDVGDHSWISISYSGHYGFSIVPADSREEAMAQPGWL